VLDLARHIVNQKASTFDPGKFEDHYEEALTELINAKRNGRTVSARPRPKGENVVDLMDALRRSIGQSEAPAPAKGKKPRKAGAGQNEMLLPIRSKRPPKESKKADKTAPARAQKRAWTFRPDEALRIVARGVDKEDRISPQIASLSQLQNRPCVTPPRRRAAYRLGFRIPHHDVRHRVRPDTRRSLRFLRQKFSRCG
jgi:hypothetical protein